MAPRKLTDADKRDVIELYRQPGETTSTIAKHYGVSTSTVSRILKTQIPDNEYRALIAQKRSAPLEKSATSSLEPEPSTPKPAKPIRRARKRSRVVEAPTLQEDGQLTLLSADDEATDLEGGQAVEADDVSAVATELLTEPVRDDDDEADLDDLDEDLDDLDDDLDADFDDDDFDSEDESALLSSAVAIMPIAEAVFPRTCYLVVDRLSELITHPLKEFAELGEIPENQESALTLPVFDNHRVARRFSRRNQRVIKVPDGQLITKTSSYLQAKGITHLLIDGNIYSLLG